MASFDIVVVGCGGGPSENNLSSYFVKAYGSSWEDGILSLDAGSGLGALSQLLDRHPGLFDSAPADDTLARDNVQERGNDSSSYQRASQVYSFIRTFLITHAHMDHICGLVLGAGSQGGPVRNIVAIESVIVTLEGVFNGRLWPRLAVRQSEPAPNSFYRYKPIATNELYISVAPNLSARAMPITHGSCSQAAGGVYDSSAFFVRNDTTSREFLFFGDVEPDSISAKPRTRNVWRVAARKILASQLDTIFLECSWKNGRPRELLFGHLSPAHVVEELSALATEIVLAQAPPPLLPTRLASTLSFLGFRAIQPTLSRVPCKQLEGVLRGLTLVIIHCKEVLEPLPPGQKINHVIAQEVKHLVDTARLGISVVAADQGMHLRI
ncbi:hypothetical protein BOTBODRAFT_395355 [Botryobasidium botryosum FD-172 SS1]|uniref:3',5'-cyclic-nucleotide phosphodiesterase n=1 Tax=Botryobasidium botryosum (strain FD-172 SS1) TaxID=930990 RepID=A0A067MEJ2_BOTB1|nr:hypothetical protein BOTBODRAFT_395355 [Botryobasidium botryosum FD-172 SS1]